MDTTYIASEYQSGARLATEYLNSHPFWQMRLFREVAKESDYCIQGFVDGLTD